MTGQQVHPRLRRRAIKALTVLGLDRTDATEAVDGNADAVSAAYNHRLMVDAVLDAYVREGATAPAVVALARAEGWTDTVAIAAATSPDRFCGMFGGVNLLVTTDRWSQVTVQFVRDARPLPTPLPTGLRDRHFDPLSVARRLVSLRDDIAAAADALTPADARARLDVAADADAIEVRHAFHAAAKGAERDPLVTLVAARIVADGTYQPA